MKTIVSVKVEGLRELEVALKELPKATAKATLKRILLKYGAPVAETMRGLAPDDPHTNRNDLKHSIAVSTRLSKRQAKLHRKENKDDRDFAEVFIGAGALPQAHLQEWGTINHGPQPFARPAWDQHKDGMLEGFKDDLWKEIAKTAARVAKKAMRMK